MTRDEYQAAKAAGQTGMIPQETDAAPQQEQQVIEQEEHIEYEPLGNGLDEPYPQEDEKETPIGNGYDDVPAEQKTAFQKALEREQKKIREKAEKEVRESVEREYSSYKKAFDELGTTPDQLLEAAQRSREEQQAKEIGYANGWDEDQTKWYLENQRKDRELQDLKISVKINDMADSPEYTGIKAMKPQLTAFMRENPRMSVEQAYWALGGKARIEQASREAEQRAIAKRSEQKRTVVSDANVVTQPGVQLTSQDARDAKRLNMSEAQAKNLLKADQQGAFKSLKEFREWKSKQKAR
ncbi:hypothetical protein [Paenibacillus qinlingensis]|uniref:Uncharacterized protein n=1 Tax=Paenibacillus qinlingensis TaxID=1837343 RepID=A0ABU1P7Z2_9BACL|nr:hypothetical protein [Paenibacillus qinlingensis]MDR6555441.1 hypothetical protein [Paenibacillus qinlingensis]